ncbi:MAG: replicative DNA helicase [Elusimicrobia bacterium HGW-Elusimicrobia-2]|nr:MAG: replicative DNA helicase [Elusimicrobia bacterium HGW-Elusimicrobia-2]
MAAKKKTDLKDIAGSAEFNVPPHDIEAERAVLGALLMDKDIIHTVSAVIGFKGDVFYDDRHRIIYESLIELLSNSIPLDLITLQSALDSKHELEKIGGIEYLSYLVETVEVSAHAADYARIVKDKYMLRRLIQSGTDIINMCFKDARPAKEVMDSSAQSIMQVTSDLTSARDFDTLSGLGKDFIRGIGDAQQSDIVKFGYKRLDTKTFGMAPGQLIIIAARPSVGKTTLGINICMNVAAQLVKKHKDSKAPAVCVFSLEMTSSEIFRRILAAEAHISGNSLRYETLDQCITSQMEDKINTTVNKLMNYPVFIDSASSPSVLEMKTRARKLASERRLALIIIDYLQLMSADDRYSRQGRQFEISKISRDLKIMAKELGVPIIALSQLSREVTKRTGKGSRPRLSDLRDSGAIEQDADLVLFLHRQDDFDENVPNPVMEVIIGKQRNGSTGTIELKFMQKFSLFTELERPIGEDTTGV